MNINRLATVLFSLLLTCSMAFADVIYENGEFAGTLGAQISVPQSISNSFTVDSRSRITLAALGLTAPEGSEPLSLTYSIGADPFGNEIATDTVLLTNEFQSTTVNGLSIFLSTFNLDVLLNPGTYWLTLSNGMSTGGADLGWLINGGPSEAFFRNADDGDEGSLESEYFRLEGELVEDTNPNPVPEPASILIVFAGLGGMLVARQRRRGAQR